MIACCCCCCCWCLEDQHLIGAALRAVLIIGTLILVIGCQRGGVIHHGLCGQMERKIKFLTKFGDGAKDVCDVCWWNVPRLVLVSCPIVINININININLKSITLEALADLTLICSGWVCIINEPRDGEEIESLLGSIRLHNASGNLCPDLPCVCVILPVVEPNLCAVKFNNCKLMLSLP